MSGEHENQSGELTPAELTATEQAAVEQALAAVAPAPPRIDRDRLMFLAGAASVASDLRLPTSGTPTQAWDVAPRPIDSRLPTPDSRLWPASTAALAATSLALAIALLVRPAPAERIVYLPQPADGAPAPSTAAIDSAGRPARVVVTPAVRTLQPFEIPVHYLRTRDVALRLGLDALGTPPGGGDAAKPIESYRSLLEAAVQ